MAFDADTRHRTANGWVAARIVAAAIGVFFVCLGVAGLTTGIAAPDLDGPPILPGSGVPLFGLFSVSVMHSVVHLVVAAAMIALGLVLGADRASADDDPALK